MRFQLSLDIGLNGVNMANRIEIQNLIYDYKSFDTTTRAIDGINLTIDSGCFVAVLGHNGSGKSTLAKLLNAIFLPTSGKILIDGMDTCDESKLLEIRRRVGMVFQNPDNQLVTNVVEDDVAFGPENIGVPPLEIRKRVDDALHTVGMSDYSKHAPHLLSGGQKQRVAIAGVIAMRPRYIVLDEPTAMLDPRGRQEVISTIKALNRDFGITVILITHHMNETIDADRLIVMADGRVIADATPREVFKNVDRLHEVGLSVPDTTDLIYKLRASGLDIPIGALSVEECARSIYDYFIRRDS